ncbi:hypothetical protein ART_1954 [Arthrobacter sp. PAMC 25486]|nr:hypothetical protein ART_1954 [Arthrobacter sp. PAMC 25486]
MVHGLMSLPLLCVGQSGHLGTMTHVMAKRETNVVTFALNR